MRALVVQLARHIVMSRWIGTWLTAFRETTEPSSIPDEIKEFDLMAKALDRESREISSLMTRLRLTPQSQYDAVKAKGDAAKVPVHMPWQIPAREPERHRSDH